MATMPTPSAEPLQPPVPGEISPAEDPTKPLTLSSLTATSSFVSLLDTSDSVLKSKGGIAQLQVYTELLRDDQVSATWGQRSLALTSMDTVVEAGADDAQSKAAAEALQAEIDTLPWDDITEKALFARFYGWGVAEVLWRPEGSRVAFDAIKVRDRGRFRFSRDGGLHLWTSGSSWVRMPDRKFWCAVAGGDNHDLLYGLGLAHSLFWPVFFKRNDIKFWLVFLEKFGQPTAVAKLTPQQLADTTPDSEGRTQRARAIAMLKQIATDAGVVVPANDKGESVVELLEAARSGAADYQSMHKVMNEAISKIVLGQTMTTDSGSSRSQAEVHEGVARRIIAADSDLLCGSFNQGPVRWWTEWNFPGATPPRVYRQTEAPEDMAQRADRDTKVFALGYEPTEDYIRETYGEGWVKKAAPVGLGALAALAGAAGAAGDQQPGNGAQPVQQDPAEPQFAEGEAAALVALRAARRGDQKALFDAARQFAAQYETINGQRMRQILQAVEFAEDPDALRRRLDEILAEAPPESTMDKLIGALAGSRLLAALRGQRRAA